MINRGTKNIKQLKDGWTILTADGKPSAHFEHDVALIDGKPKFYPHSPMCTKPWEL
jgi:methionyl aminopeptidase